MPHFCGVVQGKNLKEPHQSLRVHSAYQMVYAREPPFIELRDGIFHELDLHQFFP